MDITLRNHVRTPGDDFDVGGSTRATGEHGMSKAYDLEELGGPAQVMAGATEAGISTRRGLRVALLSLATAILLLGAAIAAVFGYHAIRGGSPAAAAPYPHHLARAPGA
jgi:hypothetical protein